MTYTSMTRDRYRLAVTAGTGLAVVGSLAAGGWLVGAAQETFEADQPAEPDQATSTAGQGARPEDRGLRQRPTRTRITMRYVRAAGGSTVGTGGSLTAPPADTGPPAAPPDVPAAPPPEPPTTPSSGS